MTQNAPAPAELASLLAKAVADITAALVMVGRQDKVREWTLPYVVALNAYDAKAAPADLVEAVKIWFDDQMESQDETTPSSVQRQNGKTWIEGWFDLPALLTAMQAYMASDGVTQMDRDAAWKLLDVATDPCAGFDEFAQAFAAYRRAVAIGLRTENRSLRERLVKAVAHMRAVTNPSGPAFHDDLASALQFLGATTPQPDPRDAEIERLREASDGINRRAIAWRDEVANMRGLFAALSVDGDACAVAREYARKALEGECPTVADIARDLAAEIERLKAKISAQARELTHKDAVLRDRSIALDAMGWVWCDGGCKGGTNRHGHSPLTEEMVQVAERNTARMKRWLANARARASRAALAKSEDK